MPTGQPSPKEAVDPFLVFEHENHPRAAPPAVRTLFANRCDPRTEFRVRTPSCPAPYNADELAATLGSEWTLLATEREHPPGGATQPFGGLPTLDTAGLTPEAPASTENSAGPCRSYMSLNRSRRRLQPAYR